MPARAVRRSARARMSAGPNTDPSAILAEPVFAGGRSKPFAELTAAEVRARPTS